MRTGAWTHKYARGVAAPSPRRFGRDTRVSASAGREVGLGEPFILPSSPKLTTNDGKAYLTLVICRGSRIGCNTDEFAGDTHATTAQFEFAGDRPSPASAWQAHLALQIIARPLTGLRSCVYENASNLG